MKTFLIGIALSVVALISSWNWCAQAQQIFRQSTTHYQTCQQLAAKIALEKSKTAHVKMAPTNYDYAKDLTRLLASCGISTERGVSLAGSRSLAFDAGVVKKTIANPISENVSLDQVVEFLLAANNADIRYFANALELTAPQKLTTGEKERWTLSHLELGFLMSNIDQ